MSSRLGGRGRAPEGTIERISLYLRHLELLQGRGETTINSAQLGKAVACTAPQVRKDLTHFGQFGRAGIGYPVEALATKIRRILGTHRRWRVALVGAGNLGSALLAYGGFATRGFDIAYAFDSDAAKAGRVIGGVRVRPMEDFQKVVRSGKVTLGMIAVGTASAQAVADMMVAAGIRGILNFAPVELSVPDDAMVNAVDMAILLERLTFHLGRRS